LTTQEKVEHMNKRIRRKISFYSCLFPQIGVWKSWEKEGLDIKDIVWPGNTHSPPPGVPEKFHLRITFLEEPPYINLSPPDPVTGKCALNKGVFCRKASGTDLEGWVHTFNKCLLLR
jgi:ionotropic glutamate receptor NMDA 2B